MPQRGEVLVTGGAVISMVMLWAPTVGTSFLVRYGRSEPPAG